MSSEKPKDQKPAIDKATMQSIKDIKETQIKQGQTISK